MTNTVPLSAPGSAPGQSQRRRLLVLVVLAVLFVLVPFMFWHETWFGRGLSDQDIER